MKESLRICLSAAALFAFSAVCAADDPPPCDKNHYILDLPCKVEATEAAIGPPSSVTTDPSGNVYFSSSSVVFRIDAEGWLIRVAGNGTHGFSGDGGPATSALLNFPAMYPELALYPTEFSELPGAIAVDAAGQVYIADAFNNRIRRVDAKGVIHTFREETANSLAVDTLGSVYVSQYGSLVKIPVEGPIEVLAEGRWLQASEGIALDPDGSVYVVRACVVVKVRPDFTYVIVAGERSRCSWQVDAGSLSYPRSVARDSEGSLFIADSRGNCIRKVDRAGAMTTFAGQCNILSWGYSGDGGPAVEAQLFQPRGVAVDSSGNVYVADTSNNRIRKIDADGIITTIAGNGDASAR